MPIPHVCLLCGYNSQWSGWMPLFSGLIMSWLTPVKNHRNTSRYWLLFSPHGATAHSGPKPPNYPGFTVGILWTSDRPVADTATWYNTTLSRDKHDPRDIRTHNPTKRERPQTQLLRPRGHWDRSWLPLIILNMQPPQPPVCCTVTLARKLTHNR